MSAMQHVLKTLNVEHILLILVQIYAMKNHLQLSKNFVTLQRFAQLLNVKYFFRFLNYFKES